MTRFIHGIFVLAFAFCVACKPSGMVSAPSELPEEPVDTADVIGQQLAAEEERALSQYKESRERKFDLLHTSLDLHFDYDSQHVIGKAELLLKPYFYEQDILELDAKDFDIHEVWLKREAGVETLKVDYDQQVVTIYLPQIYSASDTLTIGMNYTAKPNVNSSRGSEAITDNKGLYFINPHQTENKPVQIWTQGETEHNSKWFPTIDSPNERATQDLRLTVEDKYLTVSNGVLSSQVRHEDGSRTDHWVMNLPHAPYLTAVVVGEFAEVKDTVAHLPLRYIVEKKYEQGAKKVFQHTPEMVSFFSERLGVDFPWPNYDQVVVRDFVSGAMENTTASIFMEALNMDEREALDSEWDYIIAHELFHQWFGNLVTLESWANLPLNEAFADYSEYLWMEHKEGRDKADMHHTVAMENYFSEASSKQVDMIRYYHDDGEEMFDHHSYAKGGRVLHMLRKHLGDQAFYASLNYYLKRHAFSSVEIHDLRLAFEKVTGKDLNWFFNQWFLASGHPVLDVHFDHSQPDNIVLTVKQQQDRSTTPLYKLPFTVSWYNGDQRHEKKFVLNQAEQTFALENGPGTDWVVFDEALELLAERQTYYGRDHLEKQLGHARHGIARYEALDSLSNNYSYDKRMEAALKAALEDSFPSVRQLALAKIQANLDSMQLSPADEEQILAMAEGDPENIVRSAALELLSRIVKDKYAPLFFRLANDSSYYVAGAALAAYLENENNPNREALVDRYVGNSSIYILVPIADYLTARADATRADWFHRQLEELGGESLYYFIGYYGDYFARLTDLDQGPAVANLYTLAKDHSASYVRLAAFQALFGFIDEEGVLAKAREIHALEREEKVKEYQRFFLESYTEED
jgi:aminopeptidase N